MQRGNNRSYLKSLLGVLAPTLVLVILQEIIVFFGLQFYAVYEVLKNGVEEFDAATLTETLTEIIQTPAFTAPVSAVYGAIGIIAFRIWYVIVRGRDTLGGTEFVHTDGAMHFPFFTYPAVIALVVGFQFVSVYLIAILGKAYPDWYEGYVNIMKASGLLNGDVTPLIGVFTVLLSPLCEEFCFRGVTYSLARRIMPHRSANIVQALLFSSAHANPIQGIYTFIFGLVLGDIYGNTGNIWLTVMIHMAFNACGIGVGRYIAIGSTQTTFFVYLLFAMLAVYAGWRILASMRIIEITFTNEDNEQ